MPELPVRGPKVRSLGLALPPARMAPLRSGRPLKRWRYVAVYGPELMVCAGVARVAGIPRRWWAVCFPDGTLHEGSRAITLGRGRLGVAGTIDLALDEGEGVEVVSPHGSSYIWTRKQAGIRVRGRVTLGGRTWEIDGPLGFVDESAGYHARRTAWRWSAGIGRAAGGEPVAWNLVEGIHDAAHASERTVWIAGEPREAAPAAFAPDLSAVGELRFVEWAAREEHSNLLLARSDYRQPFGSFSGRLPGGPELEEGYGVMEWHDVRW